MGLGAMPARGDAQGGGRGGRGRAVSPRAFIASGLRAGLGLPARELQPLLILQEGGVCGKSPRPAPRVKPFGPWTPLGLSFPVCAAGGAIADDLEITRPCVSQQKGSWLILQGDADTRTNSPDRDSQSLSLSSGVDRDPLQTGPGDGFYSREWFF